MRRPISWVVFCVALSLLLAHSPPRVPKGEVWVDPAAASSIDLATPDTGDPQFGYVRTDGTFVPLADAAVTSASPSWR
ncbi:MAG TPA: hypothetical protein VGO61_02790 [Steroidobacteraceae bacterium]|jgi:hypothetical protein|nr:hypothetical protein [Steroidobacteraceae bacterium]